MNTNAPILFESKQSIITLGDIISALIADKVFCLKNIRCYMYSERQFSVS